jgi:hypothetical protein
VLLYLGGRGISTLLYTCKGVGNVEVFRLITATGHIVNNEGVCQPAEADDAVVLVLVASSYRVVGASNNNPRNTGHP